MRLILYAPITLAFLTLQALALDSRMPAQRFGPVTLDNLSVSGTGPITTGGRITAGALTVGGAAALGALNLTGPGSTGDISGMCAVATGGTLCRTTAARAGDRLNVKEVGAKLDGSDDTVALFAARAKVTGTGIIAVPPGPWFSNADVTGPAGSMALWQLSGNAYPGGTNPVIKIGTDIVETFIGRAGGKVFARGKTTGGDGPLMRIDDTFTTKGGTDAHVVPSLQIIGNARSQGVAVDDFFWPFLVQLTVDTPGTGKGQNVASTTSVLRPREALSDGLGPRAQGWREYGQLVDLTNQPANVAGSLLMSEHDIIANGADPNEQRRYRQMVLKSPDPQFYPDLHGQNLPDVGLADSIESGDGAAPGTTQNPAGMARIGRGYAVRLPFYRAGFDTVDGIAVTDLLTGMPAPAYRMRSGQKIEFSGESLTDSHHILFDAAAEGIALRHQTSTGLQTLATFRDDGATAIAGDLVVAGNVRRSVGFAVGTGASCAGAQPLLADTNVVNGGAGSFVRLQGKVGQSQRIYNRSGGPISVCPPTSAQIETGAVGAAVTLAANGSASYEAVTATSILTGTP